MLGQSNGTLDKAFGIRLHHGNGRRVSLYFSGADINAKVWIQFLEKSFHESLPIKKQFLERAKIFTSLDRVVAMESGWGGMSERGRRQVAQHDCDPTAYTVMMPGHGWVVPLLSSWAFIV
jgi:hypothetical protein